ncbi:MAG: hypothetical protein RMK57_15320 [Bryobacterales bacterium]|nr:hypothetical protein [Bryobacterales bacterium]
MLQHLDTLIAFAVVMAILSLMITLLVQATSALLGLRGVNLRRTVAELIDALCPNVAEHARALATEALLHPLISDSNFANLGSYRWKSDSHRPTSNSNWPKLERWRLATAVRPDELVGVIEAMAKDAAGRYPEDLRKAAAAVAGTIAGAADRIAAFRVWFDTAMDRASQRFAAQMRLLTVIFSAGLAFGVQLDAAKLLERLSLHADVRARLVASADAVAQQAAAILSPSSSAIPWVYSEAVRELKQQAPEASGLPDPPAFTTRLDAEVWLRAQLAAGAEPLIRRYREIVSSKLAAALDRLEDQAGALRAELSESRLTLLPDPYPSGRALLWSMCPLNRQFWGILISAGLLSLGAPFWFNALKTLATLRPLVATRQEAAEKRAS